MKQKHLLSKLLLLVAVLVMGAGTAWADTKTYSFAFGDNASGWSNSYAEHVYEYDEATVTFKAASKQTGTITDMPVTKGQPVSLVMKGTKTISEVTFVCKQWGTKTQTITLNYSTDGGDSYSTLDPSITSDNFTISSSNLPSGTNAVKITFSSTSNQIGVQSATITYSDSSSSLTDSDFALTGTTDLSFDLYNNPTAQVISYTTSSTGAVTVSESEYVETEVDEDNKTITVTPKKKTSGEVEITVSQATDDDYRAGSAKFTVTIDDSTPKTGGWVLTDLVDLAEGDVFVIVGDNGSTFAMSNDNGTGTAPAAVEVTIENDEITSDVDDNIMWNISGNATDGYTFYPNGDSENWLYCTNSNNGVRVGTNDASTFTISTEGYLYHSGNSRYVGVYNSQDWRCYTSINSNIKDQSFAFYKYEDSSAPAKADPELSFSSETAEATFGQDFTAPTLNTAEGFNGTVEYSSSDETVAQVMDTETGELRIVGGGTTTITASFAGNDDFKKGSASYTLTVTDNRIATTISQEDIVLDIADVATLTKLTPVVKDASDNVVEYTNNPEGEGLPEVYFDIVSDDNGIFGSFDSHGNIVLNSVVGTATIKAVYNQFQSNENYQPSECTFTLTIVDLNAPGTENNPYTVAQAKEAIDNSGNVTEVYVKGTICQVDRVNANSYATYWISDDGGTTDKFQVYHGNYLDGANFTSEDQIQMGDVVVVKGDITLFSGSTYEFSAGSKIVSLKRLSVSPATADPFIYEENGDLCVEQTFTVSGLNLTGDITVSVTGEFDLRGPSSGYGNSSLTLADGDEFGVNINDNLTAGDYEGTLTIASEGATTITIALTGTVSAYIAPTIVAAETAVDVAVAGGDGTINMTYTKIDTDLVDVEFYESDGTTTATYDWIDAEIDSEKNVYYTVGANTGEARTAYMKVYGIASTGGDTYYYSDLITITQAAYVPVDDYALFKGDLVEGDYIIYYDGYAMKNTVENSRLSYAEVTPANDVISTNDAAIVWHIAPSGEYWTIYNADAYAYAAGTGAKNKAQMLDNGTDDMAMWTVTRTNGAYEFVNKKNADSNVNSNLRNNGAYGFACYATSTGGALSLYRKVSADEEIINVSAAGYATYCSENALDFTNVSGLTAYKATVDNKQVNFTKVEQVPAGEGVLLKGTKDTENAFVVPVITTAADLGDNALIGVTSATEVEAGSFVLMNSTSGVGFYKTLNTFTVGANTAYLPASAGAARTFIGFDFDDATAIDGIAAEKMANGEVYNLQGQRVVKAQKGLYIMDGKKVLVK